MEPTIVSARLKPDVEKDLLNRGSVRSHRKLLRLYDVVHANYDKTPASKRQRTRSGGTGGGQIDFVGRRKQGNRGKGVIVIQPWESHVARKIRIFLQRVRQFRFRYFA